MRKSAKRGAPLLAFAQMEGRYRSLLPVGAFLLLIAINCIFTKNFWKIDIRHGELFGSLIDIGSQAAPEILMALAMTLVIATKGIDLSVGAIAAISGGTAALLLIEKHPLPLPVIVLISLAAGTAAGFWNGILVSYVRIQPFIATLTLMVAGRGIAQLITDGFIITLPETSALCNRFAYLTNGGFLGLPTRYFIVAAVFLVTWFVARKTVIGTYIESVGGNETAARYCGINSSLVKLFVYAFSGLCAALAGLILMGDVRSADANTIALRDHNELDAILAVIIGGTAFSGGRFNVFGSLIGALIMRTLMIQVFSSGWNWGAALVMKALTVVLVCLVQSPSFRSAFVRLAIGLPGAIGRGPQVAPSAASGLLLQTPGALWKLVQPVLRVPLALVRQVRRVNWGLLLAIPSLAWRSVSSLPTAIARFAMAAAALVWRCLSRLPKAILLWLVARVRSLFSVRRIQLLATAGVFLLLYMAAALSFKNFGTARVFVNFFVDNSFLGIVAVGMTLVIISGGIDLSVGGVVALCTVVMAWLMQSRGMHPAATWPVALLVGGTIGFLIGCAVRYFKIEPFIATLAGMFLARGLALMVSTEAIAIKHKFILDLGEMGIPLGPVWVPVHAIVLIVVVATGVYISLFTSFGRNLFGIGGNEDAALLMGLPIGRTKLFVYTFSGLCAALAAIVLTIYQPSGDPICVDGLELEAIAVSVIGGTLLTGGAGNVLGTLIGVLIYGTIRTGLDFQGQLSSYWLKVAIGALLLIFVVLQRFLSARAYRKN